MRGDVVEVRPASTEDAVRVEFFGDDIERITRFEPLTGEKSPVCQARTPEEVANWLIQLYENRLLVNKIGFESRKYAMNYYDISKSVDFFLQANGAS